MPPDPRRRRDGLCVVCEKPIRPPDRRACVAAKRAAAVDPFCSLTCCRKWHGVPLVGRDR